MRYLMWFSDGTANDPRSDTHVHHLYRMVKETDNPDIVAGYDPGVGVIKNRKDPRYWAPALLEQAFGAGLAENVRQGYSFLAKHYKPEECDHKVYLFGFSRGAYTSRSLANFVDFCGGLASRDIERSTKRFYNLYRARRIPATRILASRKEKLQMDSGVRPCTIEAVGVWDTVASVLFPTAAHPYHKDGVAGCVKSYYHALALDERRWCFRPVRFRDSDESVFDVTGNRHTLKEVWFAGVHSDVGGGYRDGKLYANLTLEWMLAQLAPEFPVSPGVCQTDVAEERHSSWKWYWLWKERRQFYKGDEFHNSVHELIRQGYHPAAMFLTK